MAKWLESPLTWKLYNDLDPMLDESQELMVAVEEQPVIAFVEIVLKACHAVRGNDFPAAWQSLSKAADILANVDLAKKISEEGISTRVLEHVLLATKYHCYLFEEKQEEAAAVLSATPKLDTKRAAERGTLSGCKSLFYSALHEKGIPEATQYSRDALLSSPDCGLWHFVLGKNLRRRRRLEQVDAHPSAEESREFQRAYELEPRRHYYGIYVAQSLREARRYFEAGELYREIYRARPDSCSVRLRLALGFVRARKFELARECLDYVERRLPHDSMLLHYKGIFYQKQKKFVEAAIYLKRSADNGNITADFQYANCQLKVDPNFDCIGHLLSIAKKCRNEQKEMKQQTFLHVAMQYYMKKRDLANALIYFSQAIKTDLNGKILKKYKNLTVDYKDYDVYDFILKNLLPEFEKLYPIVPSNLEDIVADLKNMCSQSEENCNRLQNLKL